MVHAPEVERAGSSRLSFELHRLLTLLLPFLSRELLACLLPALRQTRIPNHVPVVEKRPPVAPTLDPDVLSLQGRYEPGLDKGLFPPPGNSGCSSAARREEQLNKLSRERASTTLSADIPSPSSLADVAPPAADPEMGPRAVSLCFWALAQLGRRRTAEFVQRLTGAPAHTDSGKARIRRNKASFSSPLSALLSGEDRESSSRHPVELGRETFLFSCPWSGESLENPLDSSMSWPAALHYWTSLSIHSVVSSFPFPSHLLEWLLVRSLQHMPAFEQVDLLYVAEALCIVGPPPVPPRAPSSPASPSPPSRRASSACFWLPSVGDGERDVARAQLHSADQGAVSMRLESTASVSKGEGSQALCPTERGGRQPERDNPEGGQGVASYLPSPYGAAGSSTVENLQFSTLSASARLPLQRNLLAALLWAAADRLGLPLQDIKTEDGHDPRKSGGKTLKPIVSSSYIDLNAPTRQDDKSVLSSARGTVLRAKGGILKSSKQ